VREKFGEGFVDECYESLRVGKEIISKASYSGFCEFQATGVRFPGERRLTLTAFHGRKRLIVVGEISPAQNPTSETLDFLGVLPDGHWG
jgi:hypothetical protein